MDEREKREVPRYKVSGLKILSGRFDKTGQHEDKLLVTFGLGGCGFIGQSNDPRYQPVKRVYLKFEMPSTGQPSLHSYEVQGNVVYVQPLKSEAKEVFFYGIQFIPPHRDLVRPIVEELEALVKQGKLDYAI